MALACVMLALMGAALVLPAAAASVQIRDDANVLSASDRNNINAAAQNTSYPIIVWTTSAYSTKDAFYSAVDSAAGSNGIIMAVDPVHSWSHFAAPSNSGLNANMLTNANQQANARFGNKQWGAGFADAINSLAGAAPSGNTNPGTSNPLPAGNSSGGFSLGSLWVCLIPLILVVLAGFFLRNRMGGQRPVAPVNPVYPPQQYPNQGYPPQQYPNQGYGPGGYGQQPGSNLGGNLAAGGLGALAGGAIGYEIGRNQGEAQQGNQGQPFAPNLGGGGGGIIESAPGGSGADFGSGGGVDFGGGGNNAPDFGGGGNSADFGGGGQSL